MAITNGYATLTQVKAALRISDTVDDSLLEMAIESASRAIDGHAMRSFYSSGTGTRFYAADDSFVVQVDDFYRQRELLAGRQLLDIHLEATVTTDRPDPFIGSRQFGSDCHRQGATHGASAAGSEPAVVGLEVIITSRHHLMLADIRNDDIFAFIVARRTQSDRQHARPGHSGCNGLGRRQREFERAGPNQHGRDR